MGDLHEEPRSSTRNRECRLRKLWPRRPTGLIVPSYATLTRRRSPGSIVNKSNGWSLMLRAMSSAHRLTRLPRFLVLARAYNCYDRVILPASFILRKDSLL